MFTNQYFTGGNALQSTVMNGLNKSFDHNSYRGLYLPSRTNNALNQQFGKGSFDLGNLNHRIKLGIGLVDGIRNDRNH